MSNSPAPSAEKHEEPTMNNSLLLVKIYDEEQNGDEARVKRLNTENK